ncbi:hypothetical protein [Brucella oryzae]
MTCPLPETLRFHPACRHPGNQRFPALVNRLIPYHYAGQKPI